tara:strand:- start:6712 stop:7146 length:435 start_codon:yes stop_codon:yes gene_type:complete
MVAKEYVTEGAKEPNEGTKQVGLGGQMFSAFATSLASGLEAEGARRAARGLSGAGFASAYSSGIKGLKDFTGKLNEANAAELDKMYFKSIDDGLANEEANNLAQLDLAEQIQQGLTETFAALGIASLFQRNKQDDTSDFDGDTE